MTGHNETPQFINCGTSGQSKTHVISESGEDFNWLTRENWKYPTIHLYSVFHISYFILGFCSECKLP